MSLEPEASKKPEFQPSLTESEVDDRPDCDHDHGSFVDSDSFQVIERAAAIFRALGDSSRLRTIQRLAQREACVSELAAQMQENLSTVSQRLRLMRSERLVKRRRDGKHIFYSLADDHVLEIIQSAFDHALEEEGS